MMLIALPGGTWKIGGLGFWFLIADSSTTQVLIERFDNCMDLIIEGFVVVTAP